jgi:hypothetical protein
MRPLTYADAHATPLYDAFTSTPANGEPYSAVGPAYPLLERNPNTKQNRDLSRRYDTHHIDAAPQDVFDRILWLAVHGQRSAPPPPGPNAERGA